MNNYILFVLLLISQHVVGQEEKEEYRDFRYNIRGKAMAGPVSPEDAMATTFTLGNEFLYKRHSIGLDYTAFRFNFETDNTNKNEMDTPLYDNFLRRRYFLVDYKFVIKEKEWGDLYLNLYDKYGKFKDWYKVFNDTNITTVTSETINGLFNELGLGLGAKFYWGNFGLDVSINYAHRFENNNHQLHLPTSPYYSYDSYSERDLMYIRVNFFYEFSFIKPTPVIFKVRGD